MSANSSRGHLTARLVDLTGRSASHGKDVTLNIIRVLIVDHQPLIRSGLAKLVSAQPEFEVVGDVSAIDEAVALLGTLGWDLVVVDLQCANGEGQAFIQCVTQAHGRPLLVFTNQNEQHYGPAAIRDGATGFLKKSADEKEILLAMRTVARRELYVSGSVARTLLDELLNDRGASNASPSDALSDRELEVFELIGHCFGTREIASRLEVSIKTVNAHRSHIKAKLGYGSSDELTRQAVDWVRVQQEVAAS